MWLDDIVKKLAEDNVVNKTADNIAKAAESLTQHKDKLAEATSSVVAKEMPNIERGIGQQTLAGLMTQGQAMNPNVLDQTIRNNSQGQFLDQPSIMPQVDLGQVDVRKSLPDTVAAQSKGSFLSRLPAEAGKFMQSVGYGMLDKPLGREASTWDYLGKTVGQLARVNEGSGLSAGQPIYNDTSVQYEGLQQELAKIPDTVIADPTAKMVTYRELLRKYPKLQSFLSEYFGLTRSYEYNYPQGPAPKYNLGAPGNPTGVPAGAE
jgi:hypothetical protein